MDVGCIPPRVRAEIDPFDRDRLMKRLSAALLLVGAVAFTACTEDQNPASPEQDPGIATVAEGTADAKKGTPFEMDPAVQADIEARLTDYVKQKAAALEARRAEEGVEMPTGVATELVGYAWTGRLEGRTVGNEVFFNDRGNKQIEIQWVPEDPRRPDINGDPRTDIGYAYDAELLLFGNYSTPNVTVAETFAAIDRAIDTWDGQSCSPGLTIPRGTFFEWLFFESDVFHEGYFPLPPNVIGVTSISIFVDPVTLEPTDIDGDGALDYAFAIITYNSDFVWNIDGDIDVETIALHEMGHGLGQAHFGKAFATTSNNKLHFAPRSVMNAAYSGVQQSLTGSDRAGHCSMFGSWPNN